MGLLDLIFPKRCVSCKAFGEYLCADCFVQVSFDVSMICLVCNKYAMDGQTHPGCRTRYTIDGAVASIAYRGVAKRLIYQFKYKPYLTDLQHVMTDFFYEGLIQNEQFNILLQQEIILVPIPLHTDKQRERGYNHSEILSKNIGKRLGLETKNMLKRIKKTQTQANLKREERKENMKDAFAVENSQFSTFNSQFVILVDDIVTSGSTMLEAARVLKQAGVAKVWGIALAHGK